MLASTPRLGCSRTATQTLGGNNEFAGAIVNGGTLAITNVTQVNTLSIGGSAAAPTSAAKLRLGQYRNELDSATVDVLEAEIALAENDISNASVRANAAVRSAYLGESE